MFNRVGHWRQSWLLQVVFRPVSIRTTSWLWQGTEMIVFPRHGCFPKKAVLFCSSLSSVLCQALSTQNRSLLSGVVSLHSPLLFFVAAVVHCVTINKDCEQLVNSFLNHLYSFWLFSTWCCALVFIPGVSSTPPRIVSNRRDFMLWILCNENSLFSLCRVWNDLEYNLSIPIIWSQERCSGRTEGNVFVVPSGWGIRKNSTGL